MYGLSIFSLSINFVNYSLIWSLSMFILIFFVHCFFCPSPFLLQMVSLCEDVRNCAISYFSPWYLEPEVNDSGFGVFRYSVWEVEVNFNSSGVCVPVCICSQIFFI